MSSPFGAFFLRREQYSVAAKTHNGKPASGERWSPK